MKHMTRIALPAITLLWLFSNGMMSAVASDNPRVIPNNRLQPAIKVAPNHAPSVQVPTQHTAQPSNTPANQAGNRIKAAGVAGSRMQQIREMQRLRDLGSLVDRANPGRGGKVREDCSRSANRAACLQSSMHADNPGGLPNHDRRRSMQACLQAGGHPADCRKVGDGRVSGAGRIGAGLGSPTDGLNIPGRGQAQQGEENSHGSFQGWNVRENSSNTDGTTTDSRSGTYQDGTVVEETVTRDRNGDVVARSHTERDVHGRIIDSDEDEAFNWDDGSSTTFHHENEGKANEHHSVMSIGPIRVTPGNPNNQPAPDGSNRSADDNCDYVPGQGCRKKQPDMKGMISQPGPNGENLGVQVGGFAPHTGLEATTNCGDTSSDACNRSGFGSGSGGTPLDMKDPGLGTSAGGPPK